MSQNATPTQPTVTLAGKKGEEFKMQLDVGMYKAAGENGRTLREEVRHAASQQGVSWDPSKGDLIDQLYMDSGLLDGRFGGNSPTMKELMSQKLSNNFRAPDGSDQSIAARILYPQLILETLRENALDDDGGDLINAFNRSVAISTNIPGSLADQPIINTRGPEESESGRITQLAEPETMISITVGQTAHRIPTKSIGLTISDEALAATSVDLVRIVMEAQARGERLRRVQTQLKAMVLGDADYGMDPLPQVEAKSFDSTLTQGKISKRAYLKWLLAGGKNINIGRIFTSIDEALTLDEALLPAVTGSDASKIPAPFAGWISGKKAPDFALVEQDTFGAGVFVGLDPRYAIQRFVNVHAAYEAIEDYVMRRAKSFRVDHGEISTRLHDDAWSVMNLANT